jgi:hypothetical protein
MPYNLNTSYPKPTFSTAGQTNGTSAAVVGQRLTITSTATVQFTAFNPRTDMVILDVQAANTYCTFDGSTPSATNGHILPQGMAYTWSQAAAIAAKFVATTTTNSIIFASEFQT